MNWIPSAAALVAGLALGAATVSQRTRLEPVEPVEAVSSETTKEVETVFLPAPECEDETPMMKAIDALATELETLSRDLAVEAAMAEVEIGKPAEWPADIDPAYTEQGIEDNMAEVFNELGGGTLVGLDCGEFPCVGVVAFTGEQSSQDSSDFYVVKESRGYQYDLSNGFLYFDGEGNATLQGVVIAFYPEEVSPDLRDRYRMDEAKITFGAELNELVEASTTY